MTKILFILSLTLFSLTSAASLYQVHEEVRTFSFQTPNEKFEIQARADSFERAFEIAALRCQQRLIDSYGPQSEDNHLDIIDVCANPVR